MINCPTGISCNTSTLIGHILTNAQGNISQSGVINTAISGGNEIYCIRKILKSKYDKYKELTFYSQRNYSVDVYKQTSEWVSCNSGTTYSDIVILSKESTVQLIPYLLLRQSGSKTTPAGGLM